MKFVVIEVIPDKFVVGSVKPADSFEEAILKAIEMVQENSDETSRAIRKELERELKFETDDLWSVTIKAL